MRSLPNIPGHTIHEYAVATDSHNAENDTFSVQMKQRLNRSDEKKSLAKAERMAIDALADECSPFGFRYAEAINLWISLKSKPALLLCGSRNGSTDPFCSAISRTIVGDDSLQSQCFQGHPWWSERSTNPGNLVMAQQRLTSIRLRSFLIEAAERDDSNQLFFAFMLGISRAELQEYFVYIPRQIKSLGGVRELPFDISLDPTPYPENVYLIATIDLDYELSSEVEIYDSCALIYTNGLSSSKQNPGLSEPASPMSIQEILKDRRCFTLVGALQTLSIFNAYIPQLNALKETQALLENHHLPTFTGMVKDAYLYCANAWDAQGLGLFDIDSSRNTFMIEDFWLQQSVIPRLLNIFVNNRLLRKTFMLLLGRRYPRSHAQLTRLLDRASINPSLPFAG